jgi:TonB family protein
VRREFSFALAALLCASFAASQQASSPALSAATASAQPSIHYAGPGVMAPQPVAPALSSAFHRCGTVTLLAIVDADGKASQIDVLRTDDASLAKLASKLLAKTKFKPGTYNGVPALVAITAIIDDQICVRHLFNESMSIGVSLRESPQGNVPPATDSSPAAGSRSAEGPYEVGGNISAPIVIQSVPAKFSSYARKKKISGSCQIGFIVDVNGIPQDVHVIQSLEPSLDQNAIDAIKEYRFKPAMKGGSVPVPVVLTVKVDFKLW